MFKIKSTGDNKEAFKDGATIIAIGTHFKGDIESEASLRIDGEVTGNLTCKNKIIVGPPAQIDGNLAGTQIVIMGCVKGEITAKESLILKGKGRIEGNIYTTMLTIEPETHFNGRCQMDSQIIEMDKGRKEKDAIQKLAAATIK